MHVGAAERDPVSQTMDTAARHLLGRVYRANGGWASTRLKDPTAGQLARWILQGINVLGRDPVARGGLNARSRWARAYVRALWYQHKWYSGDPDTGGWRAVRRAAPRHPGIEVVIGPHRGPTGVIPAGRPVKVRLASVAAAQRSGRPEQAWAWADDGPRWADPGERDWAAFG